MAVTPAGSATIVFSTSAATAVITAPAGMVAGETLVVALTHQNQSTTDWTLPSGWVRVGNAYVSNDSAYRGDILLTHVVTSTDVSNQAAGAVTWTFTYPGGSGRECGWCQRFTGIDTTSPDAGHSTKPTTVGNTQTMPSFAVAVDNAYLLMMVNNQLVSPNALSVSVDNGMTQLGLVSSIGATDNTTVTRTVLGVFGKMLGAAGTSPTPMVTWPAITGAAIMAVALRPAAGNVAPTAAFTHTETGLQTSVNGTTSADADGAIASYEWDWGDGTAHGAGATASHTYSTPGSYTVKLTVTDNGGATGNVSHDVTVAYPTAAIKRMVSAGVTGVGLVWQVGPSNSKIAQKRVSRVGSGLSTPAAFIAKSGALMGHLGESWDEVEGSLEGITRSLMAGVDGIMLSLARTSDGKLFVLNDTKYLDQMQRGVKEADGGTTLDSSVMSWLQVSAYDQGSYWTKRATSLPRRPFMLLDEFLTKYPTVGPVMIDPKTIPSTYFAAILDIMDANGGPARFIAKNFCTGTSWADAAHARNAAYRTWGYFYAAGIADGSTPLSLASGHWDWIGLDIGGATAQWTAALALGKPIGGHIAKLRTDYDLGMSKGAQFIMASGVQEARRLA